MDKHSRLKHSLDIFLKLKEVLFVVAGIFLFSLNVWLAYKLAPLRDSIESITTVVEANTIRIKDYEETYTTIDTKLDTLIIDVALITGVLQGKEIIK